MPWEVLTIQTAASKTPSVYRSPAFVRLWLARVLSKAGDNLSEVALAVFAFRASGNNPLAYGAVMAVSLATPVIFGWFASGQIDRVHKKHLMVAMDVMRALLMLSIPVVGQLWWAFIAVLATQACASYYNPAIRAVLPEVVDDAQILKANAGIQNGMNAVDIPAYLIATGLVLKVGITIAFLADAASFVLAALAVGTMTLPLTAWMPRAAGQVAGFWSDIREGIHYHRDTPLVLWLLIVYMVASLGAYGLNVGMAAYIPEVLKSPVGDLGPVFAGLALGALVGSSLMARVNPPDSAFWLLTAGGFGLMALGVVGVVVADNYPAMIALTAVGGVGQAVAVVTLNTWIQKTVPAAMRGRVLSARRMGLGLAGAIGSVGAGWASAHGASWTLLALAACLMVAGVLALIRLNPVRLREASTTVAG
jgi:MFS family permease